jgi:hypothetical protein
MLAGALVGCAPSAPNDETCAALVDGTPVLRVSADQVRAGAQWTLRELWRAGGLDDDTGLTVPTSGRVGSRGILAIPDFAAATVWLLGPDGSWLPPLARRGEGPGELMNPLAAAWDAKGRLLVLDAGQARIEAFDLEADTTETLRVPPGLMAPVFDAGAVGWFGLAGTGDGFVEHPPADAGNGESVLRFARAAPGDEARRIAWEARFPTGRVPGTTAQVPTSWPRPVLAVGPDMWAVAPASDRYEIVVMETSDRPRFQLCVEDPADFGEGLPPTEALPEDLAAEYERMPVPDRPALLSRMVLDADGRLWVQREVGHSGAPWDAFFGVAGANLDAFSPDGTYLGRLRLPDDLRFQDARGDTVWTFRVGDLGEVGVVAGLLEPRSREAP